MVDRCWSRFSLANRVEYFGVSRDSNLTSLWNHSSGCVQRPMVTSAHAACRWLAKDKQAICIIKAGIDLVIILAFFFWLCMIINKCWLLFSSAFIGFGICWYYYIWYYHWHLRFVWSFSELGWCSCRFMVFFTALGMNTDSKMCEKIGDIRFIR